MRLTHFDFLRIGALSVIFHGGGSPRLGLVHRLLQLLPSVKLTSQISREPFRKQNKKIVKM